MSLLASLLDSVVVSKYPLGYRAGREEGSLAVFKLSTCMVLNGSSGYPYLAVLVEMVLITYRGETLRSIKIQISTKGKKIVTRRQLYDRFRAVFLYYILDN